MQLILASSSVYRAALLKKLGLDFDTIAPAVDETPIAGESPEALVARLSCMKAEAGAALVDVDPAEKVLVIGSDQVAVLGAAVLGKPGTAARAREQLARLSGQEVVFLTGLCLLNSAQSDPQLAVVATPVLFRSLTATQIADYVDREQPLDCAGAFKSEGLGIALFERLGGDDPNALIGLPLIQLCSMLEQAGVPVLKR